MLIYDVKISSFHKFQFIYLYLIYDVNYANRILISVRVGDYGIHTAKGLDLWEVNESNLIIENSSWIGLGFSALLRLRASKILILIHLPYY